jgi:hypothetical protein
MAANLTQKAASVLTKNIQKISGFTDVGVAS